LKSSTVLDVNKLHLQNWQFFDRNLSKSQFFHKNSLRSKAQGLSLNTCYSDYMSHA